MTDFFSLKNRDFLELSSPGALAAAAIVFRLFVLWGRIAASDKAPGIPLVGRSGGLIADGRLAKERKSLKAVMPNPIAPFSSGNLTLT